MNADALGGCYVISLRPAGAHGAIRQAAAAYGARVLALSPWKLLQRDDAATRRDLRVALACARVVFTSPTAVRAAAALQPLHLHAGRQVFAVGKATAAALRRAGVDGVIAPQRMDSEGMLNLPELRWMRSCDVGIVTAPGGRDRIAATLQGRGARIQRADVYERVPVLLSPRALASLRVLDVSMWLLVSSGEALQLVWAQMPDDLRSSLRRARVVAASARLAELAQAIGFEDITIAASALPRDLLAAAAQRRDPL